MNKEKFIEVVVDSINADNRILAQGMGMSPDEVERNIEQSQQGLQFMIGNAYDKLVENNMIQVRSTIE